jgi:hypothetical protein
MTSKRGKDTGRVLYRYIPAKPYVTLPHKDVVGGKIPVGGKIREPMKLFREE